MFYNLFYISSWISPDQIELVQIERIFMLDPKLQIIFLLFTVAFSTDVEQGSDNP